MSKKSYKKLQKESFNARLQMEEDARTQVNSRLMAIELQLKNQGRIR